MNKPLLVKKCSRCGKELPLLTAFSLKHKGKPGRQSKCLICSRVCSKLHYWKKGNVNRYAAIDRASIWAKQNPLRRKAAWKKFNAKRKLQRQEAKKQTGG